MLTVLWKDDGMEVVPTEVEMPDGVLPAFASLMGALVVIPWPVGRFRPRARNPHDCDE